MQEKNPKIRHLKFGFRSSIALTAILILHGCYSDPNGELETIDQAWSSEDFLPIASNVHANLTKDARDWVYEETGFWFGATIWHGNEDTDSSLWDGDLREDSKCLMDFVADITDVKEIKDHLTDYNGNSWPTWHLSSLQELHFMRNESKELYSWRSSQASCEISKDAMLRATLEAFRIYHGYYNDKLDLYGQLHSHCGDNTIEKVRDRFNYMLGNALHIIQDSFAKGHAERLGQDRKEIYQVCGSGGNTTENGRCNHDDAELTEQCHPVDSMQGSCAAARNASKGFLHMVANVIKDNPTELEIIDVFDRWALDDTMVYGGYFDCSTARNDDQYAEPDTTDGYYFVDDKLRAVTLVPIIFNLLG